MISTGGNLLPSSFVMSPTWTMLGNWCFVTSIGKASISLAQSGVIPFRTAASGKPPIPSKRLPIVIIVPFLNYLFTACTTVRVVFTAACAV